MPDVQIHPTAIIGPHVELGPGVSVGAFTVIDGPTTVREGTSIGSHCAINEGPHGELQIGAHSTIRSHNIIYGGSEIGEGFDVAHNCLVREGMSIGRDVRIGTYCELRGHSTIGDHCRFLANVHITPYSTVGRFVWMFANVLTTNDPHPPSDHATKGPTIEDAAILTSGVTTLPHVRIGKMAFIASNTLVARDVPPGALVRGVPGRVIGDITAIRNSDGSGSAMYPWWDHFRRGFPDDVEFPDATDVLKQIAGRREASH